MFDVSHSLKPLAKWPSRLNTCMEVSGEGEEYGEMKGDQAGGEGRGLIKMFNTERNYAHERVTTA